MKASIKFREDQKPLFRAKVPINVLGFPFQSGIVAGESKELSLNLSTFFDSGPSLKIAYRPNDSHNPFGLVFKTGTGHFGSPISSSMTMSAEFNLIGNENPSFFVHFKPQFGDFAIKKSQSSDFVKTIKPKSNGVVLEEDASVEVIDTPVLNGHVSGDKITVLPSESQTATMIGALLSGTEVSARTVLPVRKSAVVKFRWGVRFPAEEGLVAKSNPTAGISFKKIPLLVMNKIGVEHVAEGDRNETKMVGPGLQSPGNAEVAEACLKVKQQLEVIQAENGLLRKSLDDLKSEIVAGGIDFGKYREKASGGNRRGNGDKRSPELNGFGGKATEGEVNEELKKALMGATGA